MQRPIAGLTIAAALLLIASIAEAALVTQARLTGGIRPDNTGSTWVVELDGGGAKEIITILNTGVRIFSADTISDLPVYEESFLTHSEVYDPGILIEDIDNDGFIEVIACNGNYSIIIGTDAPSGVDGGGIDWDSPTELGSTIRSYPNPMNHNARVEFDLATKGEVSLEIYDAAGRRVRSLLSRETLGSGPHSLTWDGKDDRGRRLPSGQYMYRLKTAGGKGSSEKVLVLQ